MIHVELYVYYRVAMTDELRACAQVQALQQQLCRALPGLQARLLRRGAEVAAAAPGAGEAAPSTWMETYRHPDGLSTDQIAWIRQSTRGVPEACIGGRHEESFEPISGAIDVAPAMSVR